MGAKLSTKHVVLGLVIDRPGYGYDLRRRIENRFGFLGLSETMVYRVLDRLESEEHIAEAGAKVIGRTRRGSPRVMYSGTEKGVSEFRRWMQTPCEMSVLREELHVKLVLAEPRDHRYLIEQTFEQERMCVAALAELARREAPPLHHLADGETPWSEVAAALVDDAHGARLQATVEWLQRVRAVLERRVVDEDPIRLRSVS